MTKIGLLIIVFFLLAVIFLFWDQITSIRNQALGTNRKVGDVVPALSPIINPLTKPSLIPNKTEEPGIVHTATSGVSAAKIKGYLQAIEKIYGETPSPHAGYVRFLNRTSSVKKSNPLEEYFVILVSNDTPIPFSLTGWKILDFNGKKSYTFGKGVSRLFPLGRNLRENIGIEAGTVIIVSSGKSPVGDSFRINRCTGFREQFKDFSPALKRACPNVREFLEKTTKSISFSDEVCYNVLSRIGRCEAVVGRTPGASSECKAFIQEDLTEKGCVAAFKNNPSFYLPEWRVFLNSKKEIWKGDSNALYLLDNQDLLVATLIY